MRSGPVGGLKGVDLQPPLLEIHGPLRRDDLPALYTRACRVMTRAARGGSLTVDVATVAADAVAVDALARLALAARRHGCRVTIRGGSPEMWQLIELMGLVSVFLSPGAAEARTEGTAGPYPGRT
jgi:ABC-type transporter Mla MlaB component